jgi:hypothetical protein
MQCAMSDHLYLEWGETNFIVATTIIPFTFQDSALSTANHFTLSFAGKELYA